MEGVYIKFLLSNGFNNQIGNSHLLLLIFKSTGWESFNSLYTFLNHECHLCSLCPCIILWRPLHLQLCNIKYLYSRLNYAGWVVEGLCASFHVLPSLPYQYFLIAWYHFKYFLVVTNFSFSHLCMVNDDWFGKYHLNVALVPVFGFLECRIAYLSNLNLCSSLVYHLSFWVHYFPFYCWI